MVDDVRSQFRRCLFQCALDRIDNAGKGFRESLPHFFRRNVDIFRQSAHQIPSLDLHDLVTVNRIRGTDLHLDAFGSPLADEQVVPLFDKVDDRCIKLIAGTADALGNDNTAQCNDSHFRSAAADVHHHTAGRLGGRQSCTDRRCHRFFYDQNRFRPSLICGFPHCTAFHCRDTGGNADDHSGTGEHFAPHGFPDKFLQ